MKRILIPVTSFILMIAVINIAVLLLWNTSQYKIDGDPYEVIKKATENYDESIIVMSKGEKDINGLLEEYAKKSKYTTANMQITIREVNFKLNFTGIKTALLELNYNSDFKIMKAIENGGDTSRLNTAESSLMGKLQYMTSKLIDDGMSDEQKVKSIHDFIVSEYEYRVFDVPVEELSEDYFSLSGMLENKKAVCDAYGDMFRAMCLSAGLECEEVTGKVDGGYHLWNMVKLNGEYRHFDTTFDDPVPDVKGRVQYNYYNISDDEVKTRRHSYQIVCN